MKEKEVLILGGHDGDRPQLYAIAPNESVARSVIAWDLQRANPTIIFDTLTVFSDPTAKCELTGL